jgi:NDP-sugar pyrophosphorylase family protein
MLSTVVLAGGLGTRVAHLSDGLPKPMIAVEGRPFIDWKLAGLAAQGVRDVVVLAAYRADVIADHVGDGSGYGLSVVVIDEGPEPLGTSGAVRAALDRLPESFFHTNADTYLDAPMKPVQAAFESSGLPATMVVVENRDRWEPSNVVLDGDLVRAYEKGPPGRCTHLDYGLLVASRRAFTEVDTGSESTRGDLADDFTRLAACHELGAVVVDAAFHDMGTEANLLATEEHFRATGLADRLKEYLP